jgi:2-polyprenyl-6-methoxyphenol hydroxylase-like FAD-dependent oxidoreductase
VVTAIKTDIAVVGAGIIGLATAFRLAAAGREVVVVDPITSRAVAGLIERRNDAPELSAFGPSRFA